MTTPWLALCLVAPLGLASTGLAQTGTTPTAVLESATGELSRRPVAELSASSLADLGASFVRFEGLEPARGQRPAAERASVELSNGDGLSGWVIGGRGDDLELELVGETPVALSIDYLSALRFDGRLTLRQRASMAPSDEVDRLYWIGESGLDKDDGTLVELTEEGIEFEGRISKLYPWDQVAGLFLQELDGMEAEEPDPRDVAVDLVDLGRLRGSLVRLAPDVCELELVGGARAALPLGAVSEISVQDGSIVFLSDLTAIAEREGSPFDDDLGMTWPHVRDRSVSGQPLRAGGRTYARGLGVHAPSRLRYELDGGFSLLRGAVAIDDQVERLASKGSVEFRVIVDGELRWNSGIVRGGEPVREMPQIDVSDARELVLEADMGPDFHVADRADWLRVLLVRGS